MAEHKTAKKLDLADSLTRERIALILQKRKDGGKLSKTEIKELGDYERRVSFSTMESCLRDMPQCEVERVFGVSRKTLREWEMAGMPRKANGNYDWIACSTWQRDLWSRRREAMADGDDLMLRPGVHGKYTPAQLRYQDAKAGLAELELEQRKGRLVDIGLLEAGLTYYVTALRETGDRLRRKYDNEAGEILNEGMDRADAAIPSILAAAEQRLYGPDLGDKPEDKKPKRRTKANEKSKKKTPKRKATA